MFTLDNMDETKFEEFCFDLLKSLDYINMSWRKGTGLNGSPSDQGRDIEASRSRIDVDGSVHEEKWFVECKHYKKGVPPEKIQGALAWATSKRPAVLLIIASNFLSNATKNYLEDYKRENSPPYRIKIWELKDIEYVSSGHQNLRLKYNLPTELPFLNLLNKYHLMYVSRIQLNTEKFFIELMDKLDPIHRDRAFQMLYWEIIEPRYKKPTTGREKLIDLKIDDDSYAAFRNKILSKDEAYSLGYVQQIVLRGMAHLFHFSDKTSIPETLRVNNALIDSLKQRADSGESTQEEKERYTKMIELPKKIIKELPARNAQHYETYEYICGNLIKHLLNEEIYFSRNS